MENDEFLGAVEMLKPLLTPAEGAAGGPETDDGEGQLHVVIFEHETGGNKDPKERKQQAPPNPGNRRVVLLAGLSELAAQFAGFFEFGAVKTAQLFFKC